MCRSQQPRPVILCFRDIDTASININNQCEWTRINYMSNNNIRNQSKSNLSLLELEYNPKQIPADWRLAEAHGKAVRPGKITESGKMCPCCMNQINKEEIPYFQDIKQLAFLGEGFPLFYNFLKFCIIILLILLLDSCAINVLLNIYENHCNQPLPGQPDQTIERRLDTTQCATGITNELATIYTYTPTTTRVMLNWLSFLGQAIVLLYFRQQQTNYAEYLNQRNTTLADYSVCFENLPKGYQNNKKRITNLIHEIDPSLEVKEILLIEEMSEYKLQELKIQQIVSKKKQAIQKEIQEDIDKLDAQYEKQEENLQQLCNKMREHQEIYFLGTAFVVLNTEQHKKIMLSKGKDLLSSKIPLVYENYTLNDQPSTVLQAFEPREISWENIHYNLQERSIAICISWFLYLLVLAATFAVFYFLMKLKSETIQKYNQEEKTGQMAHDWQLKAAVALSYLLVILINVFNKYGLAAIAHHLTQSQKQKYFSEEQLSFAVKYMLGMFFTTALMTLAVQAVLFSNYSGDYGVVQQETFMFVFNAFFSPIMWLINPLHLYKNYVRKNSIYKQNFTQSEANLIMEYPPYDMGKRYAEVMKTMWFTFLYIELIPVGALLSFFGVILYFFVDKYVLLRTSSVKENISRHLSTQMIKVLQFTLILKPIGELLFDWKIRNQYSINSLVMLILGIIYMSVPLDQMLRKMFQQDFNQAPQTYEQAKEYMPNTYHTEYPLRKHQSYLKYKRDHPKIKFHRQLNTKSQLIVDEVMQATTERKLITSNQPGSVFPA